ncbi:MAG: SCO family protein [Deltaproteobacteria bacterium]|nr:SCO family protein [Deltaproteobacteria bacterium]
MALSFSLTLLPFSHLRASESHAEENVSPEMPPGGNFTLNSADGAISLNRYKGKVVALLFGYTECPEICPGFLTVMSRAFAGLSEDDVKKVRGFFISFDPQRDSLEKLKEYSAYFHPNIAGLSGSVEEVEKVAEQYGALYYKIEKGGSPGDYHFLHSANIYLISPEGKLEYIFNENSPPSEVTAAIRSLLEKGKL